MEDSFACGKTYTWIAIFVSHTHRFEDGFHLTVFHWNLVAVIGPSQTNKPYRGTLTVVQPMKDLVFHGLPWLPMAFPNPRQSRGPDVRPHHHIVFDPLEVFLIGLDRMPFPI